MAAEALRVYVENYNVKPFWLTSEYRNTRKADPYYCEWRCLLIALLARPC